MSQIVVFSKAGCFGCTKTIQKFTDAGLAHRVIKVDEPGGEHYLDMLKERGLTQMPCVSIYTEEFFDGETWTGLNPKKIEETLQERRGEPVSGEAA